MMLENSRCSRLHTDVALEYTPTGCAEINFAGDTWQLPRDYVALLEAAGANSADSEPNQHQLRERRTFLKNALVVRAGELPPQNELLQQVRAPKIVGVAQDESQLHQSNAAVIMLLERGVLLHTASSL